MINTLDATGTSFAPMLDVTDMGNRGAARRYSDEEENEETVIARRQ